MLAYLRWSYSQLFCHGFNLESNQYAVPDTKSSNEPEVLPAGVLLETAHEG